MTITSVEQPVATEHLVEIQHPDGYSYTGRITGKKIYSGADRDGPVEIYLTDNERLLIHDGEGFVSEVTLDELSRSDDPRAYIDVAVALGEKPVIDL